DAGEALGEIRGAGGIRTQETAAAGVCSPSAFERRAQPVAGAVGSDGEVGLDADLEWYGDAAVRPCDGAEPLVDRVAEALRGRIEPAHVQQHGIGSGAEAPAGQVGGAMKPFVQPAEQVDRDDGQSEPPVESEPGGSPVDLQVEGRLPRAETRVPGRDLAELRV